MEEKLEITKTDLVKAFKKWYHDELDADDLSDEDAVTNADYLISLLKEINSGS